MKRNTEIGIFPKPSKLRICAGDAVQETVRPERVYANQIPMDYQQPCAYWTISGERHSVFGLKIDDADVVVRCNRS